MGLRSGHRRTTVAASIGFVLALTVALGGTATSAFATGGHVAWLARYDGTGGSNAASAVAVSPDGATVYVTGHSQGYDPVEEQWLANDYATAAYDSTTGSPVWVSRYGGTGEDWATAIAQSPDGTRVFVTGWSTDAQGYRSYATVAYQAATGTQIWARRFDGPGQANDTASSIAVSPDGTLAFVTGVSGGDDATVAYDTASGDEVWTARSAGGQGSGAIRVVASPDGSAVFVTGDSLDSEGGSSVFLTIAYDSATGAELWRNDSRYGHVNDLAVSPDGSTVVATGWVVQFTDGIQNGDYATVAYAAATGDTMWTRQYKGAASTSDDLAHAVAVSPDGTRVFVTGESEGSHASAYYTTIAYDSGSGAKVWARRRYNPRQGPDRANDLAVSPDGATVYVTGYSAGTGGSDWVTVSYNAATGTKNWGRRYDDPAARGNMPNALVVSPDSTKVFVTGFGYDLRAPSHYVTIAYNAL